MLSGNNGVLQRATDAKTKSDEAQIKERIQLAYHSALAGGKGSYTKDTLMDELENEFKTDYDVDDSDDENWKMIAHGQEVIIPAGDKKENKTESHIGKYVHYNINLGIGNTSNVDDDWRVFYEENGITYLISADYVPNERIPTGTSGEHPTGLTTNGNYVVYWESSDYSTSPNLTRTEISSNAISRYKLNWLNGKTITNTMYNAMAVAHLLDTDAWKSFVISGGEEKGIEAIGTPTLELLKAYWDTKEYPEFYIKYDSNVGYNFSSSNNPPTDSDVNLSIDDSISYNDDLLFPHTGNTSYNGCWGYWIASPIGNFSFCLGYIYFGANGKASIGNLPFYMSNAGPSVRPIISMPSNLIGDNEENYEIYYID